MSTVFVDIGHTSVKWQRNEQALRRCPLNSTAQVLSSITEEATAAVVCSFVPSNQAADRLWTEIGDALPTATQHVYNHVPATDLQIAYKDIRQFGVDRFFSLYAVREQAPAVIVSVGSAIVVDVLSSSKQHAGGWIVPNGTTMQNALANDFLWSLEANPSFNEALGDSTSACVGQGCRAMLVAWLKGLANHAGVPPHARKFITGGGAAELLPSLGSEWVYRRELVVAGMKSYTGYGILPT